MLQTGLLREEDELVGPYPRVSVVIATKNRKDELRSAVRSALEQSAKPMVIVVDDGSTDGSAEMVASEFPGVLVIRNRESCGYISARNRAAVASRSEFIFSLDDDAVFSSPGIVSDTVALFEDRVGAVAIPFINVRQNNIVRQAAPKNGKILVDFSYVGTAHALRRELFVRLGGYRISFFHQGEEEDYAIRMLDSGFVVRLGTSDPIYHFESPRRDFRRMDVFGRRNQVLFAVYNVPQPFLFSGVLRAVVRGLLEGARTGRWPNMIRGLLLGFTSIPEVLSARRPVSSSAYLLFRRLKKFSKRGRFYEISELSGELGRVGGKDTPCRT